MNENFNFGLSQSQNHCSQQYVHVSFMLIHVDTRAAISAAAGWEGNKNRGAGLAAAAAAAVQRAGGVNLKGHQPASHNRGGR